MAKAARPHPVCGGLGAETKLAAQSADVALFEAPPLPALVKAGEDAIAALSRGLARGVAACEDVLQADANPKKYVGRRQQ